MLVRLARVAVNLVPVMGLVKKTVFEPPLPVVGVRVKVCVAGVGNGLSWAALNAPSTQRPPRLALVLMGPTSTLPVLMLNR